MDRQPTNRPIEDQDEEIDRDVLFEQLKRDPRVVAALERRVREIIVRNWREMTGG